MTDRRFYFEIGIMVCLSVLVFAVNVVDYAVKGRKKRGRFWYLGFQGRQRDLMLGWLWAIGLSWVTSLVWKFANTVFQVLCAGYFFYVNMHAILCRRQNARESSGHG